MKTALWKIISLLLFAVVLSACGPTTAKQATQTAPPTPVRQPAGPGSLSLGSVSVVSPHENIKTDIPILQGTYPHRDEFNRRVTDLVAYERETFRKNLADWTPVPGMTESSFNLTYTAFPYSVRFASIQLIEDVYMAGVAHPSHQMISLVYDLEAGQDVSLDQLFLPDSKYLQVIADICKAELSKRDIGFDAQQQGADPTRENYTVWNLSADGLVITFNEYQVAAYAVGPQTVIIPYAALKAVIDPHGPLGSAGK